MDGAHLPELADSWAGVVVAVAATLISLFQWLARRPKKPPAPPPPAERSLLAAEIEGNSEHLIELRRDLEELRKDVSSALSLLESFDDVGAVSGKEALLWTVQRQQLVRDVARVRRLLEPVNLRGPSDED